MEKGEKKRLPAGIAYTISFAMIILCTGCKGPLNFTLILNRGNTVNSPQSVKSKSKAQSAKAAQTLWVKTITQGDDWAQFNALAVDGTANVYAAGYQSDGYYNYGNGNIYGTASVNPVLVKYSAGGNVQWAKTIRRGAEGARFYAAALDQAGNVYAAGHQIGAGYYNYGSRDIAGTSSMSNPVLVKYNTAGETQWVKTITEGSEWAQFNALAVDQAGNVYAAGQQYGSAYYDYGSGYISGTNGTNPVLVKYDTDGNTLWAVTFADGKSAAFCAMAADSKGNVYCAGYLDDSGNSDNENGKGALTGSGSKPTLVKYDGAGNIQWTKTITQGRDGVFYAAAIDQAGNVYAAGYQFGAGDYNYGSGYLRGAGNSSNPVLVKYTAEGNAQWAKTISEGTDAVYSALVTDQAGNVYAAGQQYGRVNYSYGNGTISGSSDEWNPVLVKYDTTGNAQWAKTITAGADWARLYAAAIDQANNVYTAGYQDGTGDYNYGSGNTAGTGSRNPVLIKYGK